MILRLLLLFLVGCLGENRPSDLVFFKVKEGSYQKYINEKSMPGDPNLAQDKSIINTDYPIELALYQDGKFYYNLPTLSDGNGTWKYDNGIIALHASLTLFDMYIEISAKDEDAKNVQIYFRDRFGPKTLAMENNNVED